MAVPVEFLSFCNVTPKEDLCDAVQKTKMLLITILTPVFVGLCASTIIAVNFSGMERPNDSVIRIMGKMTREISIRYFSNFRCIIVVTENYSVDNEENVVDSVPGNIGSYKICVNTQVTMDNVTEKLMLAAMEEKCLGIIVQVSDPVFMVSAVSELSRRSKTRASRRLLFLSPSSSSSVRMQYFRAVDDVLLKMREMDFFPDLVIARFQTRERIELVTQKFTGKTTYKEQQTVDVWTKRGKSGQYGFLHSADLYPDKVSDVLGKRLKMASFTYPPYSIIDLNANPPVLDGTETRIAWEFCKKLNATFDVIVDAENEWGVIYENYTGNGILGTVAEDRAEFGYGAIYLWDYEYRYLDYSHPYIRTGVTCVAPRPKLLPGWLTPVLPFTVTSWAAVVASVVASALSLFLIAKATERFPNTEANIQTGTERYSSVLDCAFNALGLLVLQTPPDERTSSRLVGPIRHVLVWVTLMFLLITTSYSSGLASILTIPRFAPPIDTVPDLAASNIPWAATHPAWLFSLREDRDPLTVHITSQFRVMKNEDLKKHSFMGDTAFSIERLPAGHYAVGDYITEEAAATKLRLMKEDLYYEFVPIIVRKGSPYLARLNKLIHRLLDSGLILKWERQVVNSFLPMGVQRAVSQSRKISSDDCGPTKLQYKHIEGCLYLLFLGHSASTLAFVGELVYGKCRSGMSTLK